MSFTPFDPSRPRSPHYPPELLAEIERYPCCHHCTHNDCSCEPRCNYEGHPTPCERCKAEESLAAFLGWPTEKIIELGGM